MPLADVVERIVGSTALLGAFAFYFGREFTYARANAYGLDASLLGYSYQDYVLRSLDALFVPLGALTIVALLATVGHHWLQAREPDFIGSRTFISVGLGVGTLGFVLLALGIQGLFGAHIYLSRIWYLLPPMAPGLGMLCLVYGVYMVRSFFLRTSSPSRSVKFLVSILVILSVFWTASVYASALGRGRGELFVSSLRARPVVTVFSSQKLFLRGPGVKESALLAAPTVKARSSTENMAFLYRYDGLRLIIRSGGNYFLLPEGYSRHDGKAIMLMESPHLRFEFQRGDS